jgi:superfamily II RNA helicase
MDHDLFTGEAIGVIYRDQSKVEVGGCLNDETEINELLA